MIGEGEPENANGAAKLDRVKEAAYSACETVKATTKSVANVIDAGSKPGPPLDQLAERTRAAPQFFGRSVSYRVVDRQALTISPEAMRC
jgi:hypothetical protein